MTFNQALAAAKLLQQQGRLQESERLYRFVLATQKDHVECLHGLGTVLASQQRFEEASRLFRKILNQNPNAVTALTNLGNALAALGRYEDAIARYKEAIRKKPDFVLAHYNLAVKLAALGRRAEAITHYEAALAIAPNLAEAHVALGHALRSLDRHEEALKSYRRARAIAPDDQLPASCIANVLLEIGRLDEAVATFEMIAEIAPNRPRLYADLANCHRFSPEDRTLEIARKLIPSAATLSIPDQTALHFLLAKALGDIGDDEGSFRHLREANSLHRSRLGYDEAATLLALKGTEQAFTREFIQQKGKGGHPSTAPVFIVGMPRSGTSLVEQILAAHPQVFSAGELDHLELAIKGLSTANPTFPEMVQAMDGRAFDELGKRYLAALEPLAGDRRKITDKMPGNFRFIGLIHLALPHAKIIHVRRDPVDTCFSCFSRWFGGQVPYAYDLQELGQYYRAYVQLMEHWVRVLPEDVLLEVQYEDVVANLEGQARRLIAHCGLEWSDTCLAFDKVQRPVRTLSAAQVRRPIFGNSIGRWKRQGHQLAALFDALGLETPPHGAGRSVRVPGS